MSIKIETFYAPGCERCTEAREALKRVAESFGKERVTWREIDVLQDMDYTVKLGILTPPSIAIDGELVFPALPTPERLRQELQGRLAQDLRIGQAKAVTRGA